MAQIMDPILRLYFRYRQRKIEQVVAKPEKYQDRQLKWILERQKHSNYGQKHDFDSIRSLEDYQNAVPLVKYEDIAEDILTMMDGKQGVLVTDKVKWFARSSGTTRGRSKYIPTTQNYLINGHLKCTWNAASVIYNEDPTARLFADKNLIMGGSLEDLGGGRVVGDISAIMLRNFPKIGRRFSTPDIEIALDKDWDRKIKYIAQHCTKERITLLGGVPTWTMVLFKEILKETGADNICEVWPDLKSYLHGGIGFDPYREIFRKYLPSDKVIFREVYNSSEGYFAIQNKKDEDGMLLLCDHQIFYEFIPFLEYGNDDPTVLIIGDVATNVPYVMVITNSSGLYRYVIGDVIKFVSTQPYKIKVIGRTEQYINVFGEEVMVGNTDQAINEVCRRHEASVRDYTVAPVYMSESHKGGHEWAIEFIIEPKSMETFQTDLDAELRKLNSDYDAKRYQNMAMLPLIVSRLAIGTLEKWQRKHKRYGGQYKLQRLRSDRDLLEQLQAMQAKKHYAPIGPSSTPSE